MTVFQRAGGGANPVRKAFISRPGASCAELSKHRRLPGVNRKTAVAVVMRPN
jgi:hypothetical protein